MIAKALALFACVTLAGLSGCTASPESGQLGPIPATIPQPEISIELPLETELQPKYPPAQACLLSSAKSCMELDSRPFEACLVTGKNCEREGARPMLVAPSVVIDRPPR
jgi:hypothetical protein